MRFLDALNDAGTLVSGNFLKRFDTDGERDCHRSDHFNFQGNCAQGVPDSIWCDDSVKARLPKFAREGRRFAR